MHGVLVLVAEAIGSFEILLQLRNSLLAFWELLPVSNVTGKNPTLFDGGDDGLDILFIRDGVIAIQSKSSAFGRIVEHMFNGSVGIPWCF